MLNHGQSLTIDGDVSLVSGGYEAEATGEAGNFKASGRRDSVWTDSTKNLGLFDGV